MYGRIRPARAVVVHKEIVSAKDFRLRGDYLLDPLRDLRVGPPSENIFDCVAYHLDTGFDDEARDDDAYIRFKRYAFECIQQRCQKHSQRKRSVRDSVGARSHQRARMRLFALLFYISSEKHFCYHRHRYNDKRDGRVGRCRRLNDLFDRLNK